MSASGSPVTAQSSVFRFKAAPQHGVVDAAVSASGSSEPAKASSMFRFKPAPQEEQSVARKCIVCGTTRHEAMMKPFLIKGEQLNVWTNSYFGIRRNKLTNFYSKLRYTINPYACVEHFTATPVAAHSILGKVGKRACSELLEPNEEPPSIKSITEKKMSPPPEETPVPPRAQQEVVDAVMTLLKKAKEEMDDEEARRKMLRKIHRKVMALNSETDGEGGEKQGELGDTTVSAEKLKPKKKEKKKRKREKEPVKVASEADSDHSDHSIDVTGISSDDGGDGSTDDSSSEYEEEDDDDDDDVMNEVEVITASKRKLGIPSPLAVGRLLMSTPPTVVMPRMRPSNKPYRMPLAAKPPPTTPTPAKPARQVPKRLTPASAASPNVDKRPSWVMPNPGQATLASVLQNYWNEDLTDGSPIVAKPFNYVYRGKEFHRKPRPPHGRHGPSRPRYVIPDVLPGSRTKFLPASLSAPALAARPKTSKEGGGTEGIREPPIRNPLIRTTALQNNPPLSPSRLIVCCEEIVETTPTDEQLVKEGLLLEQSLSSSASEESEEESELDVCSETQRLPPVLGHPIEGVLETEARSRTTTLRTFSGSELESLTDEEGEAEVDVETVEASTSVQGGGSGRRRKRKDVCEEDEPVAMFTEVPYQPPACGPQVWKQSHFDKRKQQLCTTREGIVYRPNLAMQSKKSLILPPSAIVKPPTKLLSAAQYSMKEALHAQARAAAGMPVRIDTKGLQYGLRPEDLKGWDVRHLEARRKRLEGKPKALTGGAAHRSQSEFARLSAVVQQKLAEQRAAQAEEKKRRLRMMIDAQLMEEHPPPVLKKAVGDTASRLPDGKGDVGDRLDASLDDSLDDGSATRRSKVLRIRYHKKAEVDVSKLKVLDRSTRPQGVVRVEEVATPTVVEVEDDVVPPEPATIPEENLPQKETSEKEEEKVVEVTHVPARPSLVIVKEELLALQEQLAEQAEDALQAAKVPPPMPVVRIPDEKSMAERREMFEKKRDEFPKVERRVSKRTKEQRLARQRKEAAAAAAAEEARAAVSAAVEAVGMRTRRKSKAERAEEKEAKARKKKEMEGMMMLSDIDEDDDAEMTEKEKGREEEKEKDEEPDTCRRSNRLQEKRRSGRRPIWLAITDEEAAVVEELAPGQKKRGRPRKGTTAAPAPAPPPAKKSKAMIREEEKEVLSRVFPSDESTTESAEKVVEPKEMQEESSNVEMYAPMEVEPETAVVDREPEPAAAASATVTPQKSEPLAKQQPKYMSPITRNEARYFENEERYFLSLAKLESGPDVPTAAPDKPSYRSKQPMWKWKKRAAGDTNESRECGGRLCNFCLKQEQRFSWISNEATELLDHARTHCAETLMCPSKNCTYMNTQRARVSSHMNYVHKKSGTPIDLAEVYPSMRRSLATRLRQCFPLLPELSVCQICRVAVVPDKSHLRWHAQAHLATRVWECSVATCTEKFATEEECTDHIKVTNCGGSVLNGLTEEQAEEVAKLVERCFGKSLVRPQLKHLNRDVGSVKREDEGAPSRASTSSAQMDVDDEEESERAGPSSR